MDQLFIHLVRQSVS